MRITTLSLIITFEAFYHAKILRPLLQLRRIPAKLTYSRERILSEFKIDISSTCGEQLAFDQSINQLISHRLINPCTYRDWLLPLAPTTNRHKMMYFELIRGSEKLKRS